MSIPLTPARLAILREYNGTISIEGECNDELVVRFRSHRHTIEQIYDELFDAEEVI